MIDFPIRAIRIITDPVVDTFMLFLGQAVYPPLKYVALLLLRPVAQFVVRLVGEKVVQDVVSHATSSVSCESSKCLVLFNVWFSTSK